MNFLAHLYLACLPTGQAGYDEGLIVGNFIADSVKGNKYQLFSPTISRGILMHREVDYFSDHNPFYLQSVHLLQSAYGKYSGVITDMFYDYFLAINWNTYSPVDLRKFCDEAYHILASYRDDMPEESRMVLEYMSKHDWLYSYRETEGIRKALKGMSKRMKYYFPMDNAVTELEKNASVYSVHFSAFFPLLVEHTKQYLSLHKV